MTAAAASPTSAWVVTVNGVVGWHPVLPTIAEQDRERRPDALSFPLPPVRSKRVAAHLLGRQSPGRRHLRLPDANFHLDARLPVRRHLQRRARVRQRRTSQILPHRSRSCGATRSTSRRSSLRSPTAPFAKAINSSSRCPPRVPTTRRLFTAHLACPSGRRWTPTPASLTGRQATTSTAATQSPSWPATASRPRSSPSISPC